MNYEILKLTLILLKKQETNQVIKTHLKIKINFSSSNIHLKFQHCAEKGYLEEGDMYLFSIYTKSLGKLYE